MAQAMKDEIKLVINSILTAHPKGLTVDRLLKEYTRIECSHVPYRAMGYNSPQHMLSEMPDVVKFIRLSSGHSVVQAIPDEQSSHIYEMVAKQKNSGNRVMHNIKSLMYGSGHRPLINRSQNYYQNSSYPTSRPNYSRQPPSYAPKSAVTVNYSTSIILQLKELLQFYPKGVELRLVHELFQKKFNHSIDLNKLGCETASEFFKKYPNTFFVWQKHFSVMVCLKEQCLQPSLLVPGPELSQDHEQRTLQVKNIRLPEHSKPSQGDVHQNSIYQDTPQGPKLVTAIKPFTAVDTSGESLSKGLIDHIARLSISNTSAAPLPTNHLPLPTNHLPLPTNHLPLPTNHKVTDRRNLPPSFGVSKPRVKDVYTPDIVLKYQKMPSDVGELEYFFLIVAEVYSPGKFYWFLRQNRAVIESLTDDMNMFYNVNSDYKIAPGEIYIGQVVAAQYTDLMWYRGRIVACNRGQFEVFFLDYGSALNVGIDRVRHLHVQFTQLPIQGMRGRIFGICPVSNQQSKWSIESSKYFLSLVIGSKAIAAVTMRQEFAESDMMPVFVLALIDTNLENDIHIADCLVEKGLAEIDPSDAVEIQEPTNLILQSQSQSASPTTPFPQTASEFFFSPMKSQVDQVDVGPSHSKALSVSPVTFAESLNYISNVFRPDAIDSATLQDEDISNSVSTMLTSCRSMHTAPLKRQVKALEMADGRKLHIIKLGDEMFLSGIEMALLIPKCQTEENLDRLKAQMNLGVECTVIYAQTTPNVFIECVTLDVPWIKDNEGDMIGHIALYPLKVVSPLLFIFGAKNKEVNQAIDKQMKDVNDPHWR